MISTVAAVTAWTHDERRHRGVVGVAIRREPRAPAGEARRAPPRARSGSAPSTSQHAKAAGRCQRRGPGSRPPTSPLLASHVTAAIAGQSPTGRVDAAGGHPSGADQPEIRIREHERHERRARTTITTIMAHHECARCPVTYVGSQTSRATSTGPALGSGIGAPGPHQDHVRASTPPTDGGGRQLDGQQEEEGGRADRGQERRPARSGQDRDVLRARRGPGSSRVVSRRPVAVPGR